MRIALVAALTVALGSTAFAAEVKKDTTKAPAVSAKAMADKDMDKVTAGTVLNPVSTLSGGHSKTPDVRIPPAQAQGLFTALGARNLF
jgi:hypothetical protein